MTHDCGNKSRLKLVYFTTETKNTFHFVQNLTEFESFLIPKNGDLIIDSPFVLIFPSYGGGAAKGSIPDPVSRFIDKDDHRRNIVGIIGNGDRNYGDGFCIGARVLSEKLNVPLLYRFELRGSRVDIQNVTNGLRKVEQNLSKFLGER